MFNCACYVQCSCGWIADRGKPCNNPETTRCSTKLKYAPATFVPCKGDRVRLLDGLDWSPVDAIFTAGAYHGEVAATPRGGRDSVSVRWDGRTSCDRIRISWLEKVPAAPLTRGSE
jgi:hypothetical protein